MFDGLFIPEAIGCNPLLSGLLKYIPKGKVDNQWEPNGTWARVCLTWFIVVITGQVGSPGILLWVTYAA